MQLAVTGKGSTLANVVLSSGSSAFEPLPAAALVALSRADPTGRLGVITQLTTTSFDPYVASAPGVGITRLAFSSPVDGAPVAVENLSAPIMFTIPSNAGDELAGKQGVCSFWDTSKGVYRCVMSEEYVCRPLRPSCWQHRMSSRA